MHGVALTERAIEAVRRDPAARVLPYAPAPWAEGGVPRPLSGDALAAAVLPSGRPLSPSLRTWLAHDAGLLERHGWFTPDGRLAPRPLDRLVGDEMSQAWAPDFAWLSARFPECFLLPGGSDSRRVLAVTEPDARGEYPVLALDLDDLPYLGLMYPGFDVWLADTAGVVDLGRRETYTDLMGHPSYGPRMREHAARCFAGESGVQYPFESAPGHG
ncbi:hypothetical protein SZN_19350 [Streptomyces zinciresistens K42]|uniref:Uncharacterized protein n=1 Tax=Streptomyces zinciresistens K42 TaxID=700597 RepID=G2GED7_9ACTN|nr:hypothetical protein [Streptomyces zinciresistens]EGX58112.1 hypothetical protein SZN_19350 [Streptomyces zinciresistens K42]